MQGIDMKDALASKAITLIAAVTFMLAFACALGTPMQAHASSRWIDCVTTGSGETFQTTRNLDTDTYTVSPSGDKSGRTDRVALGMVMSECSTYGQHWDHRNKAVTVNLVPGATYYIDVYIKLYDNVTVNANGATIKQVTKGKGVFINALYKNSTDNKGAKKKLGGYKRCSNITVNGGTYITTGKKSPTVGWSKNGWPGGYSTFLFMHGQNIKISNVTIENNYNGHFIEFAGIKNSSIENCTFQGSYVGDSGNEVIQLDTNYSISCSPSGSPWDGTCCKNIIVSGCNFNVPKMPKGIGTNNNCKKRSSNITVTNNSFKVKKYAAYFCKCSKVTMSGNAFRKGKVYISKTAKKVKLSSSEKRAKTKK